VFPQVRSPARPHEDVEERSEAVGSLAAHAGVHVLVDGERGRSV
jgi:hypothetical protein